MTKPRLKLVMPGTAKRTVIILRLSRCNNCKGLAGANSDGIIGWQGPSGGVS